MQDELLWAASWLYSATRSSVYLKYIQEESISAVVAEFSWDLKYAGAQILLSEVSSNLLLFLKIST
jgi:endoglucanase